MAPWLSLGALVAVVGLAVTWGSVPIPFAHVFEVTLKAVTRGHADVPHWQEVAILELRLPRVLLAALCGGGLGVVGAAMQGLFRNPMADPGILGVSSGAALGAVTALYFGGTAAAAWLVPATSFTFALGSASLVYALSTASGRTSIATLLLAGIAFGGITSALTSFVLSLSLSQWEVGKQLLAWLMGGLEGRTWYHVALAAPLVLVGSGWLWTYARDLNVMLTGEESALSVGVDVPRVQRRLIVLTSLVTAATVAVMGVVGFLGLLVPHMVRIVLGPDHRRLMPVAFLWGALLLVLADGACRVLPLADLRLGVVTSLAGGPFFLYLLIRQRQKAATP